MTGTLDTAWRAPWASLGIYNDVVDMFERARTCDRARRFDTTVALADALKLARGIGDYGGLPCPLRVWVGVLGVLEEWAGSEDAVREGALGGLAYAAVTELISCANNTHLADEATIAKRYGDMRYMQQ